MIISGAVWSEKWETGPVKYETIATLMRAMPWPLYTRHRATGHRLELSLFRHFDAFSFSRQISNNVYNQFTSRRIYLKCKCIVALLWENDIMIRRDNDNCHRKGPGAPSHHSDGIVDIAMEPRTWIFRCQWCELWDPGADVSGDQAGDDDHGLHPGSLTSSRHLLISSLWSALYTGTGLL